MSKKTIPDMTKFMEWLFGVSAIIVLWLGLLTEKIPNTLVQENYQLVLISPIFLVGAFGIYSIVVILWRVYNFNDCEDAAEELKRQIVEAKEDLRNKGMDL